MKKLSCVYLCGDRSPYGMAHLEVIADTFDVKAIVIADHARWLQFRIMLSGGKTFEFNSYTSKIKSTFYKSIRKPFTLLRELQHQNRLKACGKKIIVINDVNTEISIEVIASLSPDILISAAYPQIFSQKLITTAPRGAVNFHPSLLPRCRGAHPHYWCLATGEKLGGVTAHYMTRNIDDGDIIAQRSFNLFGLYYAELYSRIIEETPLLVKDVAVFLANPDSKPIPQDENLVTLFRNDREIHRRLDFQAMSLEKLINRVRAGGAYAIHRGVKVFVGSVIEEESNRHMTNNVEVPPGVIVDINECGVVVSTKSPSFLVIQRIKVGRKNREYHQWVKKNQVAIGERLE